jgi:DNA-directed RNA polymerase specialized sigma54-like protein
MIQSMEILQLPLMALEERIEQELQNNPVLEMREPEGEPGARPRKSTPARTSPPRISEGEQRALVVKENSDQAEDFDRLAKISEYFENEEFNTNGGQLPPGASQLRRRARQKARRDEQHRRPRDHAGGISAGPMGVHRMPPGVRKAGEGDHQLHRCRGIFPRPSSRTSSGIQATR